MAIEKRYCEHHPDRAAIGVCVITGRAICGECSTRYEGVNYSKEGLRILQERRRKQEKAKRTGLPTVLCFILSPVVLLALYWSYEAFATVLMNVLHWNS